MIIERFPELESLSPEEMSLLANELESRALAVDVDEARDNAILQLLERRTQKYLENPSSALSMDELQARHEANKRAWREARK